MMDITILKLWSKDFIFKKDLSFLLMSTPWEKRVKTPKWNTRIEPQAVNTHVNAPKEPCTGYPLHVNIHNLNFYVEQKSLQNSRDCNGMLWFDLNNRKAIIFFQKQMRYIWAKLFME